MKTLCAFLFLCLLFVFCWPLAVLAMILFPLVWLIALPFRLGYVVIEAMLALIKAILFLPARVLGHKP